MHNAANVSASGPRFLPVSAVVSEAKVTGPQSPEIDQEDTAAYLFDLLVGARRLATSRKQRFLAYLIGMAVEEARLLTMGRSAADARRKRP
jgi:hypothetical protein